LYLTAVVLGQRQSSLLGLRWQDVDEANGRLRLPMRLIRFEGAWQLRPSRTRTKKTARSLPLPAPVAAALREHRARQQREREAAGSEWSVMEHDGREVGLVFTSPIGRPLHGRDVTERFQKRLEEAGLDRLRFHDLRHSAASVMIALKIPLKVVSEVLAHSGIQITADLYGHLEDDVLRQQLAILDAAWADDGVLADGGEQPVR
jgi:integrase